MSCYGRMSLGGHFDPVCTCISIQIRVCGTWAIRVLETPGGKLSLRTPGVFFPLANDQLSLDKDMFLDLKGKKMDFSFGSIRCNFKLLDHY